MQGLHWRVWSFKLHSEQLRLDAIHLIRICSCNCVLLCSSHIADPNHICTNELLCHVQLNSGNFSKLFSRVSRGLNGRTKSNLTCYVQCYMLRILEPGLRLLSHSTILCEPRSQKHSCACPLVCVCLLPTISDFCYICLCWTTLTQRQTTCLALETISQMLRHC